MKLLAAASWMAVTLSSSKRCRSTASAFTTHSSFSDLISRYDAFILDQFGVIHNGIKALDGAIECVRELHKSGKALIILSNTSAPSQAALDKLPKFGFDKSHFVGAVTSGEEASKYIRKTFGSSDRASKVLFITWDTSDPSNPRLTATPERFLQECGNVEVASAVEDADFVLFHGSEVWYKDALNQESLSPFIEDGDLRSVEPILQRCAERQLPAVCANPDFVVQTPTGGQAYMPGNLAVRYEWLGGKCTVFGKPHTEHFMACIEILGFDKSRVAHVGDSLHHDIAGAYKAGIPSIFVTGGIHAADFETAFGTLPPSDVLARVIQEQARDTPPSHVISSFRI